MIGIVAIAALGWVQLSLPAMSLEFPPSPNRGKPSNTAGGGTRGGPESENQVCTTGDIPLTALVPPEDEKVTTISANPEFFTYVPQTTAKQAQFLVVDEAGDAVYESTFDLPGEAGIVTVGLPERVNLEVDQSYTWQFIVLCNPNAPEDVEFVQGEITRTTLSQELRTQLNLAQAPLEKAELLAKERVWFDTLMMMAQLRESNQTEWEQLLKSVDLEKLTTAPLTSCCTTEEKSEEKPTP
ncbi:MAG: DUF928 domain-containing protein [Oscillatoriales cyanobacterium RM2_1_1]|nr:DUF928 domain-containing protein [Oscillatoriales cyanobacterium SM2_3_0]NJO45505.1 DUF928 domain-containing protein [Oscillatoriales cyanobacterium RM2_1_1]